MLELYESLRKELNKRKIITEPFYQKQLFEFFVSPEETINKYGITDKDNWSNPSILPNRLDLSWGSWLKRIRNWGRVKILHVDPENKFRGEITEDKFIKLMGASEMLKVYGRFRVEIIKIHKMELIREYVGLDGKMYKEIFQISVDLKKELKKGLHWFQYFG